ncbi:MAG: hypothetical protein MUF62_04435 [Chitinophagaceae bacterium]|jgi:hypothetical protein|nr:hypothetical protein [Chitinophagaceae bacterium]
MSKHSSHPSDEWSLSSSEAESSQRIHKVGGWFVFLLWAAGMLSIYFLLLQAGYMRPYNAANKAAPKTALTTQTEEAESLAHARLQPRANSEVVVFQSSQAFIRHFAGRYEPEELQAVLNSALSRQKQSSFKVIRVSANENVRGLSFSEDYTLAVR